ncbi:MAG TPA: hypothetical protein VFY90_09860 [Tepidiformaceae bacterium]|jgi:hypothetical protein|nr:hypothetical protein [Candidatus Eisenbacteria bacterium]HEX6031726.1 hypothetical protein [Tepidiformaceae bacterium]
MPLRYQIDDENRIVLMTGHGTVTDQEVFEYKQSVWSLESVAGYDELVDMRDVQRLDVPTAERLRELARLSAAMDVQTPSKLAIVANDPVTVEVARTYEVLRKMDRRSTRKVGVFLTVEQAALWLRPHAKKRRHSGGIAT